MAGNKIIYSPAGPLGLDDATFVAAGTTRWPDATVIHDDPELSNDIVLQVQDPGDEYEYQVFHARDHSTVATDGDDVQCARVALWVLSILPEAGPRPVVLLDYEAERAAYLEPAMTPQDVVDGWTAKPPYLTDDDYGAAPEWAARVRMPNHRA